jgi:NADPH-dependent F420 reductase
MRIGILGAGNIGGALGTLWAAQGHDIVFGVREEQSYTVQILMNRVTANARTGTMREAAAWGEVVVLAVPWQAVPEVLAQVGDLGEKILVDCTNRMVPPAPGSAASGAEEVARRAPGARVVKAFNTLGAENLANLQFGTQQASTFVCGDDLSANAVVIRLGEEIGFDVVEVGPLNTAYLVESLALLWVQLSRRYGRDVAFALLRRDERR